jgi:RNA polymerase sigma-70 factor (ECF subfamily)
VDRATERALVQRAAAGSLEAFDALMAQHRDRLFRFLIVNGASEADAEDIVQDAFLAAWRHLDGYRPRWRFSTWLFTIARRKAARRRSGVPESADQLVERGAGPERMTELAQLRGTLWASARQVLDREHFTALWLYYGEDRSTAEIARIVGRSLPWVKVALHRSRKRLGQMIDDGRIDRPGEGTP